LTSHQEEQQSEASPVGAQDKPARAISSLKILKLKSLLMSISNLDSSASARELAEKLLPLVE